MTEKYYTRKSLDKLPYREKWDKEVKCWGILLYPSRTLHESGYRKLDFIALDKEMKPICKLSGCSDVLHLDGISACLRTNTVKTSWSIDCLPNGLFRIWCGKQLTAKAALSSFELISE